MAKPPAAPQAPCPLCGKPPKNHKHWKPLYSGQACKKCVYAFVNRRQGAYIIDAIVLQLLAIFCLNHLFNMAIQVSPIATIASGAILGIVLQLLIEAFFYCKDGFNGHSPGKWLTGVQVVDESSRDPISFLQSFKRNLPLLIPFGVLIVLFQMMKGKRMGDRWANTRVIWKKHADKFPFEDRSGVCRECGYNLTGNVSGICPECGTPVPAIPVVAPIETGLPAASPQA